DLAFFSPRPAPAELARKLGAEGKFVVSYIGTVGMAHAAENIPEIAKHFRDRPDICFLIVGDGARKNKIRELVKQKKLSNVRVLPGVSRREVADYYALTDLCLVTLRNQAIFRTVIPSKIFEIMAMSKPILCSVDGECLEIIEKAECGVFAEPENVGQMVQAITRLWEQKERCLSLGKNGRQFVEIHFNRDDLARAYLDFLRTVVRE
ncbi:MAG: hypothetical protein B6245_03845, partial [Desulfobacteraceae bacterium 4572_88]